MSSSPIALLERVRPREERDLAKVIDPGLLPRNFSLHRSAASQRPGGCSWRLSAPLGQCVPFYLVWQVMWSVLLEVCVQPRLAGAG